MKPQSENGEGYIYYYLVLLPVKLIVLIKSYPLNILSVLLVILCSCKSVGVHKNPTYDYNHERDSLFVYHMKRLDSVVYKRNKKVYTCCSASIAYIEDKTGIEASTDGTTLGRLAFTKGDWLAWHEWLQKRVRN